MRRVAPPPAEPPVGTLPAPQLAESHAVQEPAPAQLAETDRALPINLATALRLADARPLIIEAARAAVETEYGLFEQARVLWLPTVYVGAAYQRHDGGQQNAQYIADKLKGTGNVIMVTGVAGTQADTDRNQGAADVFKKYPNIKVVSKFTGMWDSATAQRNTAQQLPSLPKIDGVWSSGGTDGILKAIASAGRPMPIVVGGEGENGYRRFLIGYNGKKLQYGLSLGQPPFNVLVALETARAVLKKQHAAPKSTIWLPFPQVTEKTVDFGASDAPLKPEDLDKNGLMQFPTVVGGVVPVVNVPGVKPGQLHLNGQVMRRD